jgi:hypothetical protein
MPRHRVVNRRNLDSPLVRKTLWVSPAALDAVDALAAMLHVSQGSLVDAALHLVAGLEPAEVVELLRSHGHLTDAEYAHVRKLVVEPAVPASKGG